VVPARVAFVALAIAPTLQGEEPLDYGTDHIPTEEELRQQQQQQQQQQQGYPGSSQQRGVQKRASRVCHEVVEESCSSVEGVSTASLAGCLPAAKMAGTCGTRVICGGRECATLMEATASLIGTSSRWAGGGTPTTLATSSSGGARRVSARHS